MQIPRPTDDDKAVFNALVPDRLCRAAACLVPTH
jgi:hypothetical protein